MTGRASAWQPAISYLLTGALVASCHSAWPLHTQRGNETLHANVCARLRDAERRLVFLFLFPPVP